MVFAYDPLGAIFIYHRYCFVAHAHGLNSHFIDDSLAACNFTKSFADFEFVFEGNYGAGYYYRAFSGNSSG